MTIDRLLKKLSPASPILQATFGLDLCAWQRQGHWHQLPSQLSGSRSFSSYIQTDFSEQQLELITPISSSTQGSSAAITDVTGRSIPQDELMWPLLCLPNSEDEVEIAHLENTYELHYRQGLAEKNTANGSRLFPAFITISRVGKRFDDVSLWG